MINKVASLELSKEIKELGIELETEFYYVQGFDDKEPELVWFKDGRNIPFEDEVYLVVPAPLACELLEILPTEINLNNYILPLRIFKHHVNMYCIWYGSSTLDPEDNDPNVISEGLGLEKTLGKMLIKLKKQGLI